MKKNDLITVTVDGVTAEGSGVAHPDGMAVFIKGAALGDTLSVRVIKVNKKYAIAKIEEIISPSADREDNRCAAFPACGGCAFRHITYDAEGRMKRQRVADAMKRIGGIECEVDEIVSGESQSGYRNKAQYAVGADKNGVKIGFYAERSHRIVNCKSCALQPKIFADILSVFEEFIKTNGVSVYDELSGKGLLRNIYIRRAEKTEQIMVCAVINGDRLPNCERLIESLKALLGDNLKTFVLNINKEKTNVVLGKKCVPVYGDGYITDILCGVKVRLSALSFYQVNRNMAERLYEIAADFADCDGKILLDLYCGAGTIGLSMASRAGKVFGAEIVPEAVKDAEFNAAENGIKNARFICADAYEAAKRFEAEGIRPDVVVVDPPRKGLEEGLPTFIANRFNPERVVYVSCDPATLARDCAEFEKAGYKVKKVVPVDLFPRTHHVECVALLSRKINVHKMNLNSSPFEMIKSGEKTIELRLYDEKRQQVKTGDNIIFTNTSTGETLNTTVTKLHRFNTFKELYKSLPLLQCGYTSENIDKATPSDMEQYYSIEEQNKYGVVGIELCRPKKITDETVCLLCKE